MKIVICRAAELAGLLFLLGSSECCLGLAQLIASTNGNAATVLTTAARDVLKLANAKVDEEVTLAFVRNDDRNYSLTADDILALRRAGLSDRLLMAMLSRPASPAASGNLEPTVSTPSPVASAPQYELPPEVNFAAEAVPANTVYVSSSVPAYYSFYDPWPYWWHNSWPYYSWYPYPYLSFGWYWGGYYYAGCHHDDYHHDGHPPSDHGQPPHGNNPPPPGGNPPPSGGQPPRVPPTRGALAGSGSSSSGQASSVRPPGGAITSTASVGAESRKTSGRNTPATRSIAISATGERTSVASASGSQTARPTSYWSGGANTRTTPVARSEEGQRSAASGSRPTSYWVGGQNSGMVSARSTGSAAPVAVAPSVSAGRPTATWSQPRNPSSTRYVAPSAGGNSRSGMVPVYSPRASESQSAGRSFNYTRPSASPAVRSFGSAPVMSGGGRSAAQSMPATSGVMGSGGRHR